MDTIDLNPKMQLLKKQHPKIYENLVFLNEFIPPPDFLYLKRAARKSLQASHERFKATPTAENKWIWFGAYHTIDLTPVHHHKRITRILFEHFTDRSLEIRPDGVKKKSLRLVHTTAENPFDVNPFKYQYGVNSRFQGHKLAMPKLVQDPVYAALKAISDYWNPGFNDTKERMKDFLVMIGHDPLVAEQAIEKADHFKAPELFTTPGNLIEV